MNKTFCLILTAMVSGLLSFAIDDHVVRFFADFRPLILNEFMILAANLPTVAVVVILIPVLLLWARDGKKWILPLVLSVVVAAGLTYLVKNVAVRPRPEGGLITETGFSFPSTHAAVAFSVIPALNMRFLKMRWLWVGFAFFTGFGRLYLGVHYLSDVIFGGLLGYLVGLIITRMGAWKRKRSN